MASPSSLPVVVLVGAHGHGRWHLQNIDRLHSSRRADPPGRDLRPRARGRSEDPGHRPRRARVSARLDELLPEAAAPDHHRLHAHSHPRRTRSDRGCARDRRSSWRSRRRRHSPASSSSSTASLGTGRGLPGRLPEPRFAQGAARASLEPWLDGAIGEVRGIGAAGRVAARLLVTTPVPRWAGRRVLDGVPGRRRRADQPVRPRHRHRARTSPAQPARRRAACEVELLPRQRRSRPTTPPASRAAHPRDGTAVTVAATLCADRRGRAVRVRLARHAAGRVVPRLGPPPGTPARAAARAAGRGHGRGRRRSP